MPEKNMPPPRPAQSAASSGSAFHKLDDKRVEEMMGALLRGGVLTAALVVALGAILYIARHGHSFADYRIFRGEPNDLRHLRGIFRGVRDEHGRSIIQLGLLLLIATPVARVIFSVAAFAIERDRMYVVFTLLVLAILLYSLLGA
jgi:uncharacterized membrane protein